MDLAHANRRVEADTEAVEPTLRAAPPSMVRHPGRCGLTAAGVLITGRNAAAVAGRDRTRLAGKKIDLPDADASVGVGNALFHLFSTPSPAGVSHLDAAQPAGAGKGSG